jgi:predicted MFS family arabinose efflux permease
MGFSAVSFYLALYLQDLKHLSALEVTVQLLPMVVSGVLVNVVCGLVLHRVSNKVLTGIGALAYTASFLILSFMKQEASYWAFIFPGLVLVVVGADIQFNVTNVRSTPISFLFLVFLQCVLSLRVLANFI